MRSSTRCQTSRVLGDSRFYQVSSRARKVRGLLLGLSYTFGKPEKDKDADLLNGVGGG